ncbi:MAG TPA: hypothetical protein VHE83_02000 [Mycobacteriales bacterium]|nr:hypothetical protein [Mycobacteriales bacterium]
MTRDAEELLRSVLADPAYDVTTDGDPLAPVWGKARAIRRRRALTAGGTAVVVLAGVAIAGVAITRPDAKDGPAFITQPSPTASVAPPSEVPSSAAEPSQPVSSAAVLPAATFHRTAVHIEEPFAYGSTVLGLETGEGGPTSFRVVRLDTTTGQVTRSAVVAASAGGIAAADGMVWVTSKGTDHLLRFDLADLSQLPDLVDPHGKLSGPIAAVGNAVAAADSGGISILRDSGTQTALPAPGRVCQLVTAVGGLYVVGGPQGSACIQATFVHTASGTGTDVADASDASLGLAGLVPDATGFWVEQPTGTMGYYEHVAYDPSSSQPPVVAPDHISGSNSMSVSIADGHAWISDPGLLQCAGSDGTVLWHKDLSADAGPAHVFSTSSGTVLVTNTYAEPFDTSVCG